MLKKELNFNTLLLFFILLSYIHTSKLENDYITESITYNKESTSVKVNIKYNKEPSKFSILDYNIEKPRVNAPIKLIRNLIFEFSLLL